MTEVCPECQYESDSVLGVKIHYGKEHEGTLSGVVVDCAHCGTETRKPEYKLDRSENLFCSTECHDAWRSENVSGEDAGGWQGKTVEVECENCGDVVEKYKCRVEGVENSFCDEDCYSEWKLFSDYHVDENHPLWDEGYEPYRKWASTVDWEEMREYILSRDEYSCQMCDDSNDLEVHHITPVADGGRVMDPYNMMVLCESCHRTGENAVHSTYYSSSHTKPSDIEWMSEPTYS